MTYPTKAEVCGKIYPLNTDYRVGLKCCEVAEDITIGDYERGMALIYLLFGFVPTENGDEFLRIALKYLNRGKEPQHRNETPDVDLAYDEPFIIASFQSDYQIDLTAADMHWYRFLDLLGGLTEHCVLNRVREIRSLDLNEYKDAKTRRKLADAKRSVALPLRHSAEEDADAEYFENLLKGE